MKTLIAVPAMRTVPTKFLRSLENLRRLPDTYTSISECSLIHDARNDFTASAIQNNFDRILWIDSDMVFMSDLLLKISARMDEGRDMVTALCFKRVYPTMPVIYKALEPLHNEQGEFLTPVPYGDYPRDDIFPVACCGFGAVMTSVDLLRRVWDRYGPPFDYHLNVGEDFSFCYRANQTGATIWCDSSIKVGHVGEIVYNEQTWIAQAEHGLYPDAYVGKLPGNPPSPAPANPDRTAEHASAPHPEHTASSAEGT